MPLLLGLTGSVAIPALRAKDNWPEPATCEVGVGRLDVEVGVSKGDGVKDESLVVCAVRLMVEGRRAASMGTSDKPG